jgi:hypothetical protein
MERIIPLISPTKSLVVSERRATGPFSYDTPQVKGDIFYIFG